MRIKINHDGREEKKREERKRGVGVTKIMKCWITGINKNKNAASWKGRKKIKRGG